MLSWRDPWHPSGGGAELFTHRILERLARNFGWEAEWFSAAYPGAPQEEVKEGIRFVRVGRQATVQLCAYQRYRGSTSFAVVVDQTNTIPFMTPLYLDAPVTLLIFQLAREVWFHEAPRLIQPVGYLTEPLLLRPYRRVPAITISQSTADSLRDIGLRGEISIVPVGVDDPGEDTKPAKAGTDDIIVLGRLASSKRIEESIKAAADLKALGWNGTLHVAGSGNPRYRNRLEALAASLGVRATFHGRLSDEKRDELLRAATLLWMTSIREGWGLVVTEAARHWTPAVVYNSPGLRDAVRDRQTGLVVPPEHRELAQATKSLLDDRPRLAAYAQAAREFSCELTWDRAAAAFASALEIAMNAR